MAFEVFSKGSAPVASVPTVTVQKSGTISVSPAAYQSVDSPEAFEFLYDSEANLIALRPSTTTDLNAYPAREMSRPEGSSVDRPRPVLLAGAMFLRFIGKFPTDSMRFVPEVTDGMLVIDLNAGTLVVGNRSSRRAESSTETTPTPKD